MLLWLKFIEIVGVVSICCYVYDVWVKWEKVNIGLIDGRD